MASRHVDPLTRLRQVGRATPVADEPQPDVGWTPSLPEDESRHRRPGPPVWRVGPRAAVLLCLVVLLAAAGWFVRGWLSAAEPVSPQVSLAPAAPREPAGVAQAGPTGAGTGASPSAPTAPSAAPPTVVVHVVGAVATPGVVRLPGSARVQDAVEAAGGAGPDADLGRLNLARPVADGEQVVVPRPGDPDPPAASTLVTGPGPSQAASGGLVNLNTGTVADFDSLPGIGPVLAARIVEWRTANGNFTSVDELTEVSGIGDKLFGQLRDKVTV